MRRRLSRSARQYRSIANRISSGLRNSSQSGSTRDRKRGRVGGRGEQVFVSTRRPAALPRLAAGLEQPQPADVLQKPDRAAGSAFVGEVRIARRCRQNRAEELRAKQGPVPELRTAAPAPAHAQQTPTPCRDTRSRRPACRHGRSPSSPAIGHDHRARLDDRREQPRWDADLGQQIDGPCTAFWRRGTVSCSRWCIRRTCGRSGGS